jgi:hypothetical protein
MYVPPGVLLEVDTVSKEMAGLPLPSVTEGELSEQIGGGVLVDAIPHDSVTLPAYPLAAVTVMVEVDVFPEVIEPGLSVVALRA